MPWSGGTYTKGNQATGGWAGDEALNIGIESTRHDTQDNDFTAGINACLNKAGQNTATGNLPMGGFKHTNVAVASARTDYARASQVQDGGFIWCGTSGGSANAQTLTPSPAITSYATGQKFRFIAGFSNSGAMTVNASGVGALALNTNRDGTVALGSAAVIAGGIYEAVHDGTRLRLMSLDEGIKNWTPVYTGTGTLTYTTVTTQVAQYRRVGNMVTWWLRATGTTAGAGTGINVTSPEGISVLNGSVAAGTIVTDGTIAAGYLFYDAGANVITFSRVDGANWGAGAGRLVLGTGVFEVD